MSTMPLPCHENPICLILPIGQQLPNYHKVLQLYKYVFKEIESCLQNLKEGQECGENICDLIIILCQSASGNATTVLEVTQFAYFPLNSQELWLHIHLPPYSLTSLKSSSMSTRLHQKKTLFISFLILYFAKRNKLLNANFKRNLLCRQCCIPIYVFAFTVLSPSDWTTAWLSTTGL